MTAVRIGKAINEAVIERIDIVLPCLLVEESLHLLQLRRVRRSHIVRLREIPGNVVELPPVLIEGVEPLSTHGTSCRAAAIQPSW